ncbi:hypothetical protein [Kroppenstedtia pulmonis]|uniref:HNH endonuclease n=1 Tax=Kroppenstedtia pulmonis TaxID=1380685 RepID=UPI003CCCE0F5
MSKRLQIQTCELCGSMEKIQVHHIRALKDLNKAALRILWWDSTSLHCRITPQGLFKKQVFNLIYY